MSDLSLENGILVYRSAYNTGLVAALKMAIPPTERRWVPDRKVWLIMPRYADTLAQLTRQYLQENISVPAGAAIANVQETHTLDVRYIGRTKDRGNGECTAFGWSNGEWSIIFPEPVLHEWFKDQADHKPGDPNRLRSTTLYAVLGVAQDASYGEIKRAYRRLALQWHPDHCQEPDADEQFRRIHKAYQILGDEITRVKYNAGLALEATLRSSKWAFDQATVAEMKGIQPPGYRSPLRCGLITCEGTEQLGRFVVTKILAWADIQNELGQVLVSSWPPGANMFQEVWL